MNPPHKRKRGIGNPPPKVRAPVLDPTGEGPLEKYLRGELAGGLLYCTSSAEGAGREQSRPATRRAG